MTPEPKGSEVDIIKSVGPLGEASQFATRLYSSLAVNLVIAELATWLTTVEMGLNDPRLPQEIKAEAQKDFVDINARFNQLTGSNINC